VTHLSLFSGIGGIDLAAHWAGFETVQFVERDPFCQKVLAKNFPGVPIHDDITTFSGLPFRGVTLVSGGFPCQDVSGAGKRVGVVEGTRSGLYRELLRVTREVGAQFVLMENVYGLITGGGLFTVLADLADMGMDAQWVRLRASDIKLPHTRDRIFIVAYPSGVSGFYLHQNIHSQQKSDCKGGYEWSPTTVRVYAPTLGRTFRVLAGLCRGHYGIPRELDCSKNADRLRALGNAVVPQQAYPILKAIAEMCA